MKFVLFGVLCGLVLNAAAQGNAKLGTDNQQWGYVEVRPGAEIFYWLYHTTASKNITEKPLIIVLPSGPGTSATYFNNFNIIGPLDQNLEPRNTSWVNSANVLFVDSPVGTGFSSVKSDDLYATTNTQIAEDFVNFLRGFYKAVPNLKSVPVYIFSYDYGAKIAVEAALHIAQAVKNNTLSINLKGVGLGSSWISPTDNVLFMPTYLYQLGFVDTDEFDELSDQTDKFENLTETQNWTGSLYAHYEILRSIANFSHNVNIYNVLETKEYDFNTTREVQALADKVKADLKLNTTFNGLYNDKVFEALALDFTKPVTDIVERLLNETDISLTVYNGQLDASSSILSSLSWLTSLSFSGSETHWNATKKLAISVNGIVEGYKSGGGKLSFYSVLRSGHFVAKDNPRAMQAILEDVTGNFKV